MIHNVLQYVPALTRRQIVEEVLGSHLNETVEGHQNHFTENSISEKFIVTISQVSYCDLNRGTFLALDLENHKCL